jgi:bacterioferritin (cytochrome b1)
VQTGWGLIEPGPFNPLDAREMIACLGDRDPTTHRMLEKILASEEEHADDLSSLLEGMKD